MRVLFLDIDGVLNSVDWMKTIDTDQWIAADGGTQLDPAAVLRLDRIVRVSGAKVVISSTWRKMYDAPTIQSFLARHGFTGEVIGETVKRLEVWERPEGNYQRGWEIKAWLDEHPEVTHFAVLDDDSDMDKVADHFVHTAYPSGLLDAHVPKVLALLGYSSSSSQ